jgi:hypothetical protein
MFRFFLAWGTVVIGLFTYVDYRGWSPSTYNELRNIPKSIRDNPGIYRSMYQRYYHK